MIKSSKILALIILICLLIAILLGIILGINGRKTSQRIDAGVTAIDSNRTDVTAIDSNRTNVTAIDSNRTDVGIELFMTGERLVPVNERSSTEPHKMSIFKSDYNTSCSCVTWSANLIFEDDELPNGREFSDSREVCGSDEYSVVLTHPGTYRISLQSDNCIGERDYKNLYVRREVRDLTAKEWKDYVDAVWILKNTSTTEGRTKYNCPHYYEYDFFVLFHGMHSANGTCDQLHFSMLQEFAHEAWFYMFEKALQCVNPSVALHYWDADGDFESLGDNVQLSSIFSDTYYGNGLDNDNGVVSNGMFANFPIRQNRDGMCEFIEDSSYCERYIREFGGWMNPDPSAGGFINMQPRDLSDLQLVSRKTGFLGGISGFENYLFPQTAKIMSNICNVGFNYAIRYVTGDDIHGFAHYWVSGLWGDWAADLLSRMYNLGPDYAWYFRQYVWNQDARLRFDGCIECTNTTCTCAQGRSGCDDDDIETPGDSFDVQDHSYSPLSMWWEWLHVTRGYYPWRKETFGCTMFQGGTFDRSTVANQDPVFYAHHVWTLAVLDLAKRLSSDNYPFFGMENYTANECDGHRLNDTTIFSNIVPYTSGQTPGQKHKWSDIFYWWAPERRHYWYDYRVDVTKADC